MDPGNGGVLDPHSIIVYPLKRTWVAKPEALAKPRWQVRYVRMSRERSFGELCLTAMRAAMRRWGLSWAMGRRNRSSLPGRGLGAASLQALSVHDRAWMLATYGRLLSA